MKIKNLSKNCLQCYKQFLAQCISRLDRVKFCSRICKVDSQKKEKQEIECIQCRSKYHILIGRKRTFCSSPCQDQWRLLKRLSNKKICQQCSKEFTRKKGDHADMKFCSVKCAIISRTITDPLHLSILYYSKVIKTNECWEWKGNTDTDGYGILYFNKKTLKAHRVSWEISKGPITNNLFVLHKCDNPPCTNTDHLFLGTARDNILDMIKKGRRKAARGEKASSAKLKNEHVFEIRKMLNQKIPQTMIAKQFKVDPTTIKSIKNGKTWSHLKE